jgi:hypothetical protein
LSSLPPSPYTHLFLFLPPSSCLPETLRGPCCHRRQGCLLRLVTKIQVLLRNRPATGVRPSTNPFCNTLLLRGPTMQIRSRPARI